MNSQPANEDREVESLLRRYRVAEPHPSLRARVLSGVRSRRAVTIGRIDWVLVAATLVMVVLVIATTPQGGPVAVDAPTDLVWRARVTQVADLLGGDPDAVRHAERLVPRQEPSPANRIRGWEAQTQERGQEDSWRIDR